MVPVATHQRIDDQRADSSLAGVLAGNERGHRVAVLSLLAGRPGTWIDEDEIANVDGASDDVRLIPAGPVTAKFSDCVTTGTPGYRSAANGVASG